MTQDALENHRVCCAYRLAPVVRAEEMRCSITSSNLKQRVMGNSIVKTASIKYHKYLNINKNPYYCAKKTPTYNKHQHTSKF